jgi:hypothetical protein
MNEPELNKEFKNNSFKVPDGYFEAFDAKVLDRLNGKDHQLKGWSFYKRWGIAASILLVLGSGVFFYWNQPDSELDFSKVDISQSELQRFQNDVEMTEDEFIDLLNASAVDSCYRLEVISVSDNVARNPEINSIQEEFSPLEDEFEI